MDQIEGSVSGKSNLKKYYCTLLIFVSLIGCKGESTLNSIVESEFGECRDMKDCIVDLKEAMPFKWDYLFCFHEGIPNTAVSKTIGFNYTGDKEFSRLILFTLDNKIVYEEKQQVNYDKPYKVNFRGAKYKYSSTNSKFKIEPIVGRNSFILTHVQK